MTQLNYPIFYECKMLIKNIPLLEDIATPNFDIFGSVYNLVQIALKVVQCNVLQTQMVKNYKVWLLLIPFHEFKRASRSSQCLPIGHVTA